MGQKCHASGRIRRQGGSKKNTLSPNMVDSSPDSDNESDSVPLNAKGHPTTAGKLFFNRCINTHLGMVFQPTRLTDTEVELVWTSPKDNKDEYHPDETKRYTEENCPEWKPGTIESKDVLPVSCWIISHETGRRLRRNRHDIKKRKSTTMMLPARATTEPDNTPSVSPSSVIPPMHFNVSPPECSTVPVAEPVPAVIPPAPPEEQNPKTPAVKSPAKHAHSPRKSRAGRSIKVNKDPNFVYNWAGAEDLTPTVRYVLGPLSPVV